MSDKIQKDELARAVEAAEQIAKSQIVASEGTPPKPEGYMKIENPAPAKDGMDWHAAMKSAVESAVNPRFDALEARIAKAEDRMQHAPPMKKDPETKKDEKEDEAMKSLREEMRGVAKSVSLMGQYMLGQRPAVETAPAPRAQHVPPSMGNRTAQQDFIAKSAFGEQALSKSAIADVIEDMLRKGEQGVTQIDLLGFEGFGKLRPDLAQRIQSRVAAR